MKIAAIVATLQFFQLAVVTVADGYCNYQGCDGIPAGGPWCNENKNNCEGNCSGKWCERGYCNWNGCDGVPAKGWCNKKAMNCEGTACNGTWCPGTAAPTTSTPSTSPTTSTPTTTPSTAPSLGPTLQPTQCHDEPTAKFFFRMDTTSDPEKPIYKTCEWLVASPKDKRERICLKKTDSHGEYGPAREVCKAACRICNPTDEPSVSPTFGSPTISPSKRPTNSPTRYLGRCCSQDFKRCSFNAPGWCHQSSANCLQCNGIEIIGSPLKCIARWEECTNDVNSCCYPATCVGDGARKTCQSPN